MTRNILKWDRIRPMCYRAVCPSGRAYDICQPYKSGEWVLVAYPNEDAEHGDKCGYGSLNSMKAQAQLVERIAISEDAGE